MKRERCTAFLFVGLLAAFSVASAIAAPLRLDFTDSTGAGGGPAGLQGDFAEFAATGGRPATLSFANDELAGVGNSIDVTIAGQCCYRNYAAATVSIRDLLSNEPKSCSMTPPKVGLHPQLALQDASEAPIRHQCHRFVQFCVTTNPGGYLTSSYADYDNLGRR